MNIIEKFVNYIRSSRQELTKVTWPSRDVTTRYSILVIVISISVAAFFGVLDIGLTELVNKTLVERAVQTAPAAVPEAPVVPTTVPTDASGQPIQPEFDFSEVDIETSDPNADINIETLPIEETNNQ
ncbi:MAG: preprotein translocase subunit SecE [Patescibacteria group bacterium]|nr:preprotein translocase subunit SecE [Patescibacteria group bacterium]